MEARDNRGQVVLASGVNLIAGLWLIAAPFVLGFTAYNGSEWNNIIVGAIVAVLAAVRLWGGFGTGWLSWVNVVLGLWLIVSPWIFGNSGVSAILWDDIIIGAIIVVFGAWSAMAARSRV